MKSWRELDPDQQAELILSGATMCEVCGGHGTIQQIPSGKNYNCFTCRGKGYKHDVDINYQRWWRIIRREPCGPPSPGWRKTVW